MTLGSLIEVWSVDNHFILLHTWQGIHGTEKWKQLTAGLLVWVRGGIKGTICSWFV